MATVISVEQARQLDQKTIEEVGIPSLVLMERAALAIYDNLLADERFNLKRVLVLVGTGNNGGDALAVARLLHTHGFAVSLLLVGKTEHRSPQMTKQLEICEYYQIPAVPLTVDFSQYSTIVDGLFGSGLSRQVAGDFAQVIQRANVSGSSIHAIDIPSGFNGDSGQPLGATIQATSTTTVAYVKTGMIQPGAAQFTGTILVADIGIYLNDHYEE